METVMHNIKNKSLIRLVDDDEEFLDAVTFLLQIEGWRTVTFSGGLEFLESSDDTPGCIILDARMPDLTGPEVQDRLEQKGIRLPIIFLTGHGDLDLAVHVFRAGACDFLQKPVKRDNLIAAVTRAVTRDFERRDKEARDTPLGRWDLLTEREKEIISDVAKFLSNRAIAEHFGISERTVEAHRASGMKKLGLHKPEETARLMEALRNRSI